MINFATFSRISRVLTLVLVALAFAPFAAHAQAQAPQVPIQPTRMGAEQTTPGFGNANTNSGPRDPDQARMLKDMSKERNALRQKQIVEDTEHLLDLAKQLKDAVDKSSKDQLSLEVVNTATEIEKLAKTVKEKMRDGN
jgi:hypothetical protein